MSEIALVVDDVRVAAEAVPRAASLKQYKGGDSEVLALGMSTGCCC